MARQKEFDQDEALDIAMTLFWQKGYGATSVQDLVDNMGIGRRSLYDTFKSKHDLFIAALDRYQAMRERSQAATIESLVSPKTIIQEIFEGIVAESLTDSYRKGCFHVNSGVELAGQDDEMTVRSRVVYQSLEEEFHRLLIQAQQTGELSPDRDIRALAQYLTNSVFGLRVMAKVNPDEKVLTNIVNLTLSSLD